MTDILLLATRDGLASAQRNGNGWALTRRSLEGRHLTALLAREGVILGGSVNGVVRSDDGGSTWASADGGLSLPYVRWMAYHPDISDREFAGTEPAGIFVSHDGAGSWRPCPEVPDMRDRFRWSLPYSPEAGCVRGFAFHGTRVYAAVEVGGVLRSDDAGETWRLAGGSTGEPSFDIPPAPQVHADVHSVASHPSSPDLAWAATAEGLYRSDDGGDTWTVTQAGMYCRAVWVDPVDPSHLILGPADSVSRMNGRIEESHDGGGSWHPLTDGLDLPWPNRMVERFFHLGDELFAVTNDGQTYLKAPSSGGWNRVLPEIEGVTALAAMHL